jgi:thiosulfate/3-mercaptopyruvate sulfurtransferase
VFPVHPLISTAELGSIIDRPDTAVLDVRWRLIGPSGRADYDEAHLPGAVFVDLDTELAAPPDHRGRHPMPTGEAFQATMRSLGVSRGSRVVCYDQSDGMAAARAWWLLCYFGHDAVQLLDGGYAGWVASGGTVTADVPRRHPGDFVARPGQMALVDAKGAAHIAQKGLLLDARARERYAGDTEPVDPVAGHIPGAESAPTVDNVEASGHFLSAGALRQRFADLGAAPGGAVATYCGSGVNAAHQVLALEIAGIPAALYADSWSGWITDPTRPVATGYERG